MKAISEIKNTPGVGLFLTDKTNNIVIAEESMVNEKVFDHLNGPSYYRPFRANINASGLVVY